MPSQSLWGEIAQLETVRSPKGILKEQASFLTEATNSVLMGQVDRYSRGDGKFAYSLDVMVPSLNNYVYTILRIEHDIDLYPVIVKSSKPSNNIPCADEEHFVNAVENILKSPEVMNVIASLISQAE